jgi:hypothetical protein
MPEFYAEVLEGLPMKAVVHPSGPLNLAAYMPNHTIPPDLGAQ